MTNMTEFEQEMYRSGDPRRIEQQLLLLDAAEQISRLMEKHGVSRTDLAQRIGKSKGFVTQVLNGRHNMTLRTLADLAWALEARLRIQEADSFWSFVNPEVSTEESVRRPNSKLLYFTGVAA